MSHSVRIKDAVKKYGDFTEVDGITMDIHSGEFFTLLGPSGCGKTTLLRMIAGFNTIDGGEIYFDDKRINNVEAHKRDTGMVFQNYAIFPHLSVEDNVAYGLKARKIKDPELSDRVHEALELVQIEKLAKRLPNELSGGQQQRVALARAIVIEPGVLLMDEPLSNLDAKLRVQMRTIIKRLQRRLGITTIYVTHDQEEALAISDRIAVMKQGKIMQIGEPKDIYLHPENPFVANFIGTSNFLDVDIEGKDPNNALMKIGDDTRVQMKLTRSYSGPAQLSVRPEQLYLTFEESDDSLKANVDISVFLGDFIEYEVTTESGAVLQVNQYTKDSNEIIPDGETVYLKFRHDLVSLYDMEGNVLS